MKDIERITNIENNKYQDYKDRAELAKLSHNELISWLTTHFTAISFITLTFDTNWMAAGRRQPLAGHVDPVTKNWVIPSWQSYGWVMRWRDFINRLVIGKNYKNSWKHSYFGYVLTKEYQKNGVEHFHMLIDSWFPYEYSSNWWWRRCGMCKIEGVSDLPGSLRYTLKYCTKGDNEPVIWIPEKRFDVNSIDVSAIYKRSMDDPSLLA
jgi:hypothetical protein